MNAFIFLVLFLAATAPRTNAFVHALHTDALALLVSALSFWTMLFYLESPSRTRIVLMALCPGTRLLDKAISYQLGSGHVCLFVDQSAQGSKTGRSLFGCRDGIHFNRRWRLLPVVGT